MGRPPPDNDSPGRSRTTQEIALAACTNHPPGARGVGESATGGAPPAIVNAVVDALAHPGVRHLEIPMSPDRVWRIPKEKGVAL